VINHALTSTMQTNIPERRSFPMPFGFHWPELLVVMVIALLFFGPKRLPEMGNAIGKTFKEFRKSVNEITDQAKVELPAPQAIADHSSPASVAEPVATTDA
jgi:sec-independent protein translocase protein TatA